MGSLKDMDSDFWKFSAQLSPPCRLVTLWNTEIHWLIVKLRQKLKKKHKFGRHIVGGSMSKKTAVLQADYDCVMFLNDALPPFTNVIEDFKTVLANVSSVSSIDNTRCSVQFTLNNELHVDILPAPNMVKETGQLDKVGVVRLQSERILEKMKTINEEKRYLYNSSLNESAVLAMKKQSSYVHIIVKLAKFWYRLVCDSRHEIMGLKYLIEVVAMHCAQEIENENTAKEKLSVTIALEHFFSILSNISKIDYTRRGFVYNPSNPYNNLLTQVKNDPDHNGARAIQSIQSYAVITLQNLNHFRNNAIGAGNNDWRLVQKQKQIFTWLTTIFSIPAYRSLNPNPNRCFVFGTCFSFFNGWRHYLKEMKSLKLNLIPSTHIDRDSIIENAFKAGVAIAKFVTVEGESRRGLTAMKKRLEFERNMIINYLDLQTDTNLQQRLTSNSKDNYVLPLHGSGNSVSSKIEEFRNTTTMIFHAPIQRGPCILDGYSGTEVLYCCFLFVREKR